MINYQSRSYNAQLDLQSLISQQYKYWKYEDFYVHITKVMQEMTHPFIALYYESLAAPPNRGDVSLTIRICLCYFTSILVSCKPRFVEISTLTFINFLFPKPYRVSVMYCPRQIVFIFVCYFNDHFLLILIVSI